MNPTSTAAAVSSAVFAGTSLLSTERKVKISITNNSMHTLEQPRIYTYSGHCHHTPQPTISKNNKESCSFTKSSLSAWGAAGVLTYRIHTDAQNCIGELAIMFSVPYNYTIYENCFALGFLNEGDPCDEKLYSQMYYKDGPFMRASGTGSSIKFSQDNILVTGTMSPQSQSVMIVEFWDIMLNPTQANSDCIIQ
uniref:Uncharacterized protein n=1 Tax=Astyanax mexicanus TaxID=7994 RepID=A0A3B1JNX4_ASTMX